MRAPRGKAPRETIIDQDDPHHDAAAREDISDGLPFLDVQLVEGRDFTMLVEQFFATDRHATPKGPVEVIL